MDDGLRLGITTQNGHDGKKVLDMVYHALGLQGVSNTRWVLGDGDGDDDDDGGGLSPWGLVDARSQCASVGGVPVSPFMLKGLEIGRCQCQSDSFYSRSPAWSHP